MTRYITDEETGKRVALLVDLTPLDEEMEEPEQYRLYRLCPCGSCSLTGKVDGKRCPDCRGEGRSLDLVATCGSREAVGVALVTLSSEGEWDECPFGLMHRPTGKTGRWLLKPWGPSPRQISDAARTLAHARHQQ